MKLKKYVLIFFLVYIITGVIMVNAGNKKLIKAQELCLGAPDKILTEEPAGIELYSPFLEFHSTSIRHAQNKQPYESDGITNSIIIPVLPMVSYYRFSYVGDGSSCGGDGFVYIWFNGINFKELGAFITQQG